MGIRTRNLFLLIIGCFMLCHTRCSSMRTLLRRGETLQYPDQLLSKSRKFLLCFFDPIDEYSRNQNVFLGLFYHQKIFPSSHPLWVADINAKYRDGSANLTLDNDGSLKLLYEGGRSFVLYSSQAPSNSNVILQDDGNLVLREFNSDGSLRHVLWQSFDYPTGTLLPGMKLGFNNRTGKNLTLVSQRLQGYDYKSPSYTLGVDPAKINQLVIWWVGDLYWTSGPWKNGNFTLATALSRNENLNFNYVSNENGTYFTFSAFEDIFNPHLKLDIDGCLALITCDSMTLDNRGSYKLITCDSRDILVDCYSYHHYYGENDGCLEKLQECQERKFYDFNPRWGIMSNSGTKMSKDLTKYDCRRKCEINCSCVAFASANDTECVVWSQGSTFREASVLDGGNLINTPIFQSDFQKKGKKLPWWIWLAIALGGAALFIMISWYSYVVAKRCWCVVAKRCKREVETRRAQRMLLREIGGDRLPSSTERKKENKTQRELHIFSFKTIVSATNNFSHENQLGKGGYGPVYKGRLLDGQEIAIKRLSTSSGQGLVEFKKEAILIAKLQHTNLVRLLGFCVQGEEKALVYEYMPNKSLDFFLFDSTRKKILDWKKRFIIIEGIAQGLVYLHKYSRLKIIHRDLKASNILLDLEMNPKISDFGMARLLGSEDSEENTNKIVGTFGYMPPEYALQGTVSIKTDVFSFGILLLEIVSGRKNNSRYHPDHPLNLTRYAWTLWKEGKGVELIDPSLDESIPRDEVTKCIQVGLLCVQDQASSRPTMIDVVFMLSTESAQLPLPRKPAFFISSISETPEEAQTRVEIFSINEMTMSNMEVR